MLVKELIEQLQRHDPYAQVTISDADGHCATVLGIDTMIGKHTIELQTSTVKPTELEMEDASEEGWREGYNAFLKAATAALEEKGETKAVEIIEDIEIEDAITA